MPTVTVSKNTGADYAGATDTNLVSTAPTTNYATAINADISKYAVGDHNHALFVFDVSAIGAGQTVSAATWSGVVYYGNLYGYTVSARRVLRDVVITQSTWNIWKTSNNWGTAGGISDGADRVGTASGATASITGTGTWTISSGLTADVEGWINGTLSNYGWHFARTDAGEDTHYIGFYSAEGTDGSRPSLSITYSSSTPQTWLSYQRALRPKIFAPGSPRR
jgi:hypothetical protein